MSETISFFKQNMTSETSVLVDSVYHSRRKKNKSLYVKKHISSLCKYV